MVSDKLHFHSIGKEIMLAKTYLNGLCGGFPHFIVGSFSEPYFL